MKQEDVQALVEKSGFDWESLGFRDRMCFKNLVSLASEKERDACAQINEARAWRMDEEASYAKEEGDEAAETGCHASAWLLKVCAIDMRARGDKS